MRVLLLFAACCGAVFAEMAGLPEQFHVVERFPSFSLIFDITSEEGIFAVARKQIFSVATQFDLEDAQQRLLASASSRLFSWGIVVDVMDPDGNRIGWIEEEIFRILPWAEYRVFNKENQLVAIAKMNFWGTCFELAHPDNSNEMYATIERPFFRYYRDDWTVKILNPLVFAEKIIDPCLLVILAICQSDKDYRDSIRRNIINQIIHNNEYNN